jgi:hypothetical protein
MVSEEQFRSPPSVSKNWDFTSRLVAELSHQLNSPLGALFSAIDTLQKAFDQVEAGMRENNVTRQELQKLAPLIKVSVGTARQACERMDASMKTLRRYINLDQASPRKMDVRECIEDSLGLLAGSLQGGITVIKELWPIPSLECFPRELNIALTSLLISSIEGIKGSGEICIRTAPQNGGVLIKIADTAETDLSAEAIRRCSEVARMHHGQMTSKKHATKGNEITLQLPVLEPSPAADQLEAIIDPRKKDDMPSGQPVDEGSLPMRAKSL